MNTILNTKTNKIIAGLASLAFVFTIIYVAAIFNAVTAHAAERLVYANVMIEDDSMRPLALSLPSPSVNVGASVDASASVNANSNTNSNTNTNSTSNSNNSTSNNSSSNTTNNTNSTTNANANANVNTTATTNNGTSSTSASLNVPVNISTTNDLTLYTKTLQEEDRDLGAVITNDDSLTVSYRKPAKFLGFIPTSVTARATVDAEGNVSLSYPWYTFLSTKNDAELRASLQTKVDGVVGNSNLQDLDVRSRAEVIETLRLALKEE